MSAKTRAPGGGRKPLSQTEPTVERTVSLLASQIARLEQIGNGNLSLGIRKAIEMTTAIRPVNAEQKIQKMLIETYGDAGRVTAMTVWKGYDVSTGKTGWHMRDFGVSNVHFMGSSVAEVAEWCVEVASSFEQVN